MGCQAWGKVFYIRDLTESSRQAAEGSLMLSYLILIYKLHTLHTNTRKRMRTRMKGRNLNHATSSIHHVSIPEHVVMIFMMPLVPRVVELP